MKTQKVSLKKMLEKQDSELVAFLVRLTAEEKKVIENEAGYQRRSVNNFVVKVLLDLCLENSTKRLLK